MFSRLLTAFRLHRKTLSLLSGSQAINLSIGFLNGLLWTRCFDREVYGSYQLILSAIGIVSTFCISGLATSASISSARGIDGNYNLLVKRKLLAGILGSVAMLIWAGFYWKQGKTGVAIGLALFSPFLSGLLLQEISIAWVNSKRDFFRLSVYQTFPTLVSTMGLGVSLATGNKTLPFLILTTQGLAAVIQAIIAFRMSKTHCSNSKTDYGIIRYGYHATLASFLGWIVFADKIVVYQKLSAEALAIYSVALIFPGQLKTVYSIMGQFINPAMNEATSVREAWEKLKFKLGVLAVFFVLVGVVSYLLLPILIPLFFSDRYVKASEYGKVIMLAFSLNIPATYLGSILRAQQKKAFLYSFEILQPATSLILYIWLVEYGLNGMMWAQVIRYGFWTIFTVICFWYYLTREQETA